MTEWKAIRPSYRQTKELIERWSSNEEKKMIKTYWYKFWYHYCPLCGRTQTFKERQYSKKPKEGQKRHIFKEIFDWCEW